MTARSPRERRLLVAGGVLVSVFAVQAIEGFPIGSSAFFVVLSFAVVAYLAALRVVARPSLSDDRPAASARLVLIVLLVGLAMRVPMATAPVGAQSDLFRYLWDARLQRAGLNPYEVAPADPAAAHLGIGDVRQINNPSVPSPYPPAAQLFFRLATAVSESVYALRAAVVFCDVLIGLLLWRWLLLQGWNPLLVVVYAWNPLVALEVAGGHLDAVGALLVLVTAFAFSRQQRTLAAISFAAAVAMKFLPVVLLPLLWKRLRLRDAAIGVLALIALYAPYVSGWRMPLGSVSDVVARFRFNAPVFGMLEHVLGARGATGAAVLVGLAVAMLPPVRRRAGEPGAWAWPMAAALACSPLVYPWYLVWLAPFLVTRGTAPLFAWTISILPVYVVWDVAGRGGHWTVPPPVIAVEYGVVGITAAALLLMWRRSGEAVRPAAARQRLPDLGRVSVVIPTFNERDAIANVLRDIPKALVSEIIVVDSDSTDGTREVAAALGARIVREPRRGYGRACLTGMAAASDPDVVVFLDGDYSDRPAELPQLLGPLQEGLADIVVGSRLAGRMQSGAMPWYARWGNRFAASLIRGLYGVSVTDLGPFRAARADVLQTLGLREAMYGWPVEMIAQGALRGYRVVEVPVSYYPRIGRSKISGTLRGAVGAAYGILTGVLKYRMRAARPTVRRAG